VLADIVEQSALLQRRQVLQQIAQLVCTNSLATTSFQLRAQDPQHIDLVRQLGSFEVQAIIPVDQSFATTHSWPT